MAFSVKEQKYRFTWLRACTPLSASPASRQTMSPEIPLITHIVHWLAPKLPRDTRQIIPFQVPTLVSNGFQIISGRERITINLAFSSRVWPWMHERDSGARQPSAHSKFLFPGHLPSVLSARIPPPTTRRGWRDIRPQSENIRPSVSSESVSGATKRGWDFVPETDTRNKSWNLAEHRRAGMRLREPLFAFLSRSSFCYSSLSVCPHCKVRKYFLFSF